MKQTILAAGLGLALVAGVRAAEAPLAPEELARRAEVVRPSPDELRWQQLPWLTSLVEARQTAQRERRPIFLWVSSDPPLDRC
jgi:hypothetical protein